MSERIRVLVVDDSAFVRKAVGRMLATADDIEVVGFARDGEEGLALARELRPDVVTLDVRMPRLGGLETLERLMAEQPVPVLLMSTLTQEGAEVTLRGLELGAMEFVDKSSVQPMSMLSLAEELVSKIRALGGARVRSRPRPQPAADKAAGRAPAQCVAIAASTGGPSALQTVVSGLPAAFAAAVVIVQHIPRGFTRSLAERLDARSAIPVREARHGDAVEPGLVLLAPAGIHTRLVRAQRRRPDLARGGAERGAAPALGRRADELGRRRLRSARGRRGADRHGLGRHRGAARDPRARRADARGGGGDLRDLRHAEGRDRSRRDRAHAGARPHRW